MMNLNDWRRVLVFGAHVDDEIIGPGGTISRLSDMGAEVFVVTFTGGTKDTGYSRADLKDKIAEMRRAEAGAADAILGIKERIFLGRPSQGVVNDTATYQECVRLIRQIKPDVIFSHWYEDKHRDHRAVAEITDEARWKAWDHVLVDLGAPYYTPEFYFYEILELFPHPTILVDISATINTKIEAMEAMTSQLDVLPRVAQYIRGVGQTRGFQRGSEYAEAFLRSNLLATPL
ncbi:MAG: PIG-L family deacetylase [Chloroflexi bacterium]|nr:PIG-L family deacetylase [Chloroflexota bacterium]